MAAAIFSISLTNREIVTIQQKFAKKFQALTPGHVIFRVQEALVSGKYFIVIRFQEFGTQDFMSG